MNDPLLWSIGLLALGLGLIVLEIFVPSGGVLSVLAVVAVLASIAVAFTGEGGVVRGAIMVTVTAILVPIVVAAAVHWWPHSPLGRLILIKQPRPDSPLGDDESQELKTLVGKTGRARSKMLPSGVVAIEGRSYDAVSEGMPIEPGERVRVVSIRTRRIVVRPDDGTAPSTIPAAAPQRADDVLSRPAESLGIESLDDPLA